MARGNLAQAGLVCTALVSSIPATPGKGTTPGFIGRTRHLAGEDNALPRAFHLGVSDGDSRNQRPPCEPFGELMVVGLVVGKLRKAGLHEVCLLYTSRCV